MSTGFIERTIATLAAAADYSESAEQLAFESGVLQRIDPRVKVAGLFGLVAVVAASSRLTIIGFLFAFALLLAWLSHIGLSKLSGRVWMPVLFFSGTIALPAIFLTPGRPVAAFAGLFITLQGLRSAAFLLSRAETAATLSALLILTTPWTWVLKALRTFRCPIVLVAILGMTCRYIFVVLQTASEMFESRKSRTVGVLEPGERRRLAASTAGVLLGKSLQLSGEVHLAMQSRGFRGEVHVMHNFHAGRSDWFWLFGFAVLVSAGLWWGR